MPLKTVSGKHADPRKGRGAGINPEGRFESVTREAFDDGWNTPPGDDLAPLKTLVTAARRYLDGQRVTNGSREL